jgi:regulator of sigma E protease
VSLGSTLFAFVVLLGVLIFVHELGHFLVAKACGVRVLKFSLGFGAPIGLGRFRLRWKRHHTEYVIAWFPLGGFVKLLGEQPGDAETPEARAHPSETLGAKPAWQKLAIFFAGPLMNLLLPVVIFAAMLFVGMPQPLAVVGGVEPGSPAAEAGLRAGDRIVSIGGQPIEWWQDVFDAIRRSAGERIPLVYERTGEEGRTELAVAERRGVDEFGGVDDFGWAGLRHERLGAVLGIPGADAPAVAAGLRSGDRVSAVGGTPVESWEELAAAYAGAAGSASLEVVRGLGEGEQTLRLEVPALGGLEALGVVPATALVVQVEADTPAARAGIQPGDLILSVDGEPVGSFHSFAEAVRTSGGRELQLGVARQGELRSVRVSPELAAVDTGLGIEEERYRVGIAAHAATLPGAIAVEKVRNPIVATGRAVAMTHALTSSFLRGLGKLITGEVSRRQIAGPIGIAQIAGKALERGIDAYLQMLVLISINLGILNLLPIPILDGGQALIVIIESVKRAPLSLRTREFVQQIGLTVLVLLIGLAFWNDISRNWSRILDWLRTGSGL